ncbi:MAG: hypothetical protein A6F70_04960 [Cycloclasticus sp. symbiont of Bathymodiolus heckerae]|nr:MAG: hypothetical protein A6F70_04960 [Cycloclasticus sp. symbiont of Bathymodiolus heckerae]
MDIKLQNQLGIQVVSDLKAELESAVAAGDSVVLDASEVESVDTAGLQLLVAFVQHAALKKCEFEWRAPSDAFLEIAKLMGLSDALQV